MDPTSELLEEKRRRAKGEGRREGGEEGKGKGEGGGWRSEGKKNEKLG